MAAGSGVGSAWPGAAAVAGGPAAPGGGGGELTLREQLDAVERGIISRTMAATRGNQSEAARRLGMSRPTLIERLRRYGIGSGAGAEAAGPA